MLARFSPNCFELVKKKIKVALRSVDLFFSLVPRNDSSGRKAGNGVLIRRALRNYDVLSIQLDARREFGSNAKATPTSRYGSVL